VLAWVAPSFLERLPSSVIPFERKETVMQSGTIKKLVSDRGFGFIAAEDGKEYFFHRSGTNADFDRLLGGEHVTFEVETSPKGPRAAKVQVL
jgi:CspA family cold shock protein